MFSPHTTQSPPAMIELTPRSIAHPDGLLTGVANGLLQGSMTKSTRRPLKLTSRTLARASPVIVSMPAGDSNRCQPDRSNRRVLGQQLTAANAAALVRVPEELLVSLVLPKFIVPSHT